MLSRTLALAVAFVTVTSPLEWTPAYGQENSAEAQLLEQIESLRTEVARLNENVERLESRFGQSEPSASDFSPVLLTIRTEEGRPLSGVRVRMTSRGSDGRRVEATGLSDDKGTLLSRNLPYGRYTLALTEPTGWYARVNSFLVEPGKAARHEIVAPDPTAKATLTISSAIRREAFEGLRFGTLKRRESMSILTTYTPEPSGDQTSRFDSFPTIAAGLQEVGALARVYVSQKVDQTDGKPLLWSQENNTQRLLLTNEGVRRVEKIEGATVSLSRSPDAVFFVQTSNFGRETYSVGHHLVDASDHLDSLEITISAGDVHLQIEELVARAEGRVLGALGFGRDDDPSRVWLGTTLNKGTQWSNKALSTAGWRPRSTSSVGGGYSLLEKTINLAAGEARQLTVQ
ncbi:hypothetical protein Mal64_17150 [Pseudobythopirellula maris]|uniref:Cna protein B-type domain protein n=1 Tax=Pseudobythopirellula maris TaxID=2527991 RepID=A0A5C5ZMB3_9BACT|nr:carboxypeptidase-like regulatory domain-containing protein [Pseudobythopirellula maris]TWT88236.1 hypothetical protein Mal64_17150 [Pseudobythopirellula maris]